MYLKELLSGINCKVHGDKNIDIKNLQYDSRNVQSGDLFFCISGTAADGHAYAPDAVKNGAVAIVVTKLVDNVHVTQVVVKDDRAAMALCAANFYGHPAKRLKMVGVTGTNGKTTTTYMVKSIAEAAGYKVGLIGTIKNMIGQREMHTERTTPESADLQRLLREMADEKCDIVVMEVSSHSLLLKRVYGIEFDVGVFSNLTQDHLDFHQTWENYVESKSKLFQQSRISVVNVDDDSAANMISAASREVMEYSVLHPTGYMAKHVKNAPDGVDYDVKIDGKVLDIHVPIPGLFTVYNSLAALVACHALKIDGVYIKQGLAAMQAVPGRFELLDVRGQGYSIILDYSHTPDSLENALLTVKEFARGKVITVFGCGGNRDAGKRPVMGRIAAKYSDYVVVTSDNPRFEEPDAIIAQIEAGVAEGNVQYITIEDRKKAMAHAMKMAQQDDIILLAGKGHETYQEIRGVKHDFDEKVVVNEIMDEMGIKTKK